VLGRAVERGARVAVHVSSTVALTRYGGSGPDLPLGDIELPYAQSKIASEVVARRLQDAGAPVVTIYPGAVYGPHDPYRGEQGERLRWILRGLFPFWPREGQHVVDVRDAAAVITAVLGRDKPYRYVVPGHHVGGRLVFGTLAEVTGRRLPHLVVPAAVLSPAGRLIDRAHRLLPGGWRYPADREGIELARRDTRFDDSVARAELGVEPTSFRQSIADTVRWLVESGRIPARRAPRLRPNPTGAGSPP
jgi:dihydroflavonol-4-reductase